MPLVSIVIPTFNRAELVGETLDSVLAQTFTDWECFVVDDGSTDNVREVTAEFVARDARFHAVAQGKLGHEAAWARGASLATGAYMAFLDSDDVWQPDFLEKMIALLRSDSGAVVAAAPHWAWDGENLLYTQEFDARVRANPRVAMIRRCFVFPSQCLFVRATLAKTKGFRRFPSDDYDLWMQLLPHGRMVLAAEPLVKYRRLHGGDSDTSGRALQYCRNDIWILTQFARQPGLSLFERVLALANVQRKHELLLDTERKAGLAPRSRAARLARLLGIVPTPLLRSPRFALDYLRGDGPEPSPPVSTGAGQIDIVIPTHNRADLIGETLTSVLGQTFTAWQCWIIDDGSTDDTQAIVEKFAGRDSRFHYQRQENSGRPSAWKHGLTLTNGEYVALLDSDDVWKPEFLHATLGLLKAQPKAALAAAPFENWDGERVLSTQDFPAALRRDPVAAVIRGEYIIPSQCLFRRSALATVKEFRFWPSDDVDLLLQILPGRGAAFARQPLVLYRRHGGNTWGDAISFDKLRLQAVLFIGMLGKFAARPDVPLPYRLLALGNRQRKYEQILELDMDQGTAPRSLLTRLWRLLRIVPTPLLRSPGLARRYLRFR